MSSTAASHITGSNPGCVGFLEVIQAPPTVQKHVCLGQLEKIVASISDLKTMIKSLFSPQVSKKLTRVASYLAKERSMYSE